MADKPITFSAPMVLALLDGRKSQTRRVLKPQPEADARFSGFERDGQALFVRGCFYGKLRVPYAPGDRLYVREAHAIVGSVDPGWLLYRADGYESECIRHGFTRPFPPESAVRWRPSIHMPRWASRLTLIVTDVRVQRLQEISETDARAEGAIALGADESPDPDHRSFVWGFSTLWNSLHGPDAWDANPWVVALTFTVHRCNIDQMENADG